MSDSNLHYIVVSTTSKGIIKGVEIFDSYRKAVGYAKAKYGGGDELFDETIVFEVDPPEDVGRPVYIVDMKRHKYDPDDEIEIEEIKPTEMQVSDTFELVNVEQAYDIKTIPSKKKRAYLKKGDIVQVAVATQDSYEKCWLIIERATTKQIKRKGKKAATAKTFIGRLMELPETFVAPQNMKINFKVENILAIEE